MDYLFDDLVRGVITTVGGKKIPLLRRVTDSIQTGVYYGYNFKDKYGALGVYLGVSLNLKPSRKARPREGLLQARPVSNPPVWLYRP